MRYVCMQCNKTMSADEKPKFCPFCGNQSLVSFAGRTEALKTVQEISALTPKLEHAWDVYRELHDKYELASAELSQYRRRGLVLDDEVVRPELGKLKSCKELKEAQKDG